MFGLPMWAVYAIVAAGIYLAGFGTGWQVNGWRLGTKVAELETKVVAAVDQGKVLARAVDTCNAGVKAAADVGAKVQAAIPGLLDAARKAHAAGTAQAGKLDQLLTQTAPPGADCREAWAAIEAQQKAGAAR